jgi:hypothetical protein
MKHTKPQMGICRTCRSVRVLTNGQCRDCRANAAAAAPGGDAAPPKPPPS